MLVMRPRGLGVGNWVQGCAIAGHAESRLTSSLELRRLRFSSSMASWLCNVRFEHAHDDDHDDGNFPGFVSYAHALVANAENDRKPAGERGLSES